MRTGVGRLGLLALAAAGCGSAAGPSVLHGPLAFPVVIVEAYTYPLISDETPDGGWPAVDLGIQSFCILTDGLGQPAGTVMVGLQIWNPDGGPIVAGTWPFIDPSADPSSGSASLYYRDLSYNSTFQGPGVGVGGSVTLTEAGPAYVGSFATTVNGQSFSGSFSTAGPNQCACTQLSGGGESCPEF